MEALTPILLVALTGALLALVPLGWVALRHRGVDLSGRLRALTLVTLFLTFDLVLFGAFTRLTDSGLGCPDWPGCYSSATPLGAHGEISAAQAERPHGPVTHGKAWVEMVHRYLATAVGALITVLMVASLWLARRDRSARIDARWAVLCFVWVCAQGAFGALTVTMKLYPAIVTLHLLGGIGLAALLAVQAQRHRGSMLRLGSGVWQAAWGVLGLVLVQIALGGWVSTNYAVLACSDFPTCQGQWWPDMHFGHAFTLQRELGQTADGRYLPFAALTAIHMVHRLMAPLVLLALAWLVWRLIANGEPAARRIGAALAGVAALQVATGLGNVVLGWPIAAALLHSGGAAALVMLLVTLLAASHAPAPQPQAAPLRDTRLAR